MKSKLKNHTPGPWKFFEDKRYGAYPIRNVHYFDWIIESPTRKLMAVLSVPALAMPISQHSEQLRVEHKKTLAEVKANARLIAAAPDLLEALQNIESNLTGKDCFQERIEDSLRRAKQAILKATEGK